MTTTSKASDREEFLADEEAAGHGVKMLPTINQQGEMPDNHAVLAWFSCLCCCWPIGVFAIITSWSVQEKWLKGDFDGAYQASETAQKASLAAILAGLVVSILYMMSTMSTG